MNRALNQRLEEEVPRRLAELLAMPLNLIKVQRQPAAGRGKPVQADLLVAVGEFNFVVEWKTTGQAAAVAMAARAAQQFAAQWKKKSIPLVAVPYMGEVGRRLCEEADVCWLDLSGNAHLVAPGLRLTIEGKPNQFKRPGRPRSVFAPKSAWIAATAGRLPLNLDTTHWYGQQFRQPFWHLFLQPLTQCSTHIV
jgi:hypothetical protein